MTKIKIIEKHRNIFCLRMKLFLNKTKGKVKRIVTELYSLGRAVSIKNLKKNRIRKAPKINLFLLIFSKI